MAPSDTEDRIALFIPLLVGGGAERVMLNLARAIAAEGVAVDMVVVRAEGVLLEEVRSLQGVRLVALGGRKASTSAWALARYLQDVRPFGIISALNTPNLTSIVVARLVRYRGAAIATVHNTLGTEASHARSLAGRVTPALMRMILPFADAVVAVSAGVADDLSAAIGMPRQNVKVIYNPVVSPGLYQAATEEVADPTLLSENLPTFVGIGRLAEQKDFGTLIDAFRLVRDQRPCRLVILGEGPARAALEKQVRDLGLDGDVSLPGFVKNPYAVLARAQTFVLSSRWEGLPTVLIEALALGVPVVATDCKSGPHEILAAGRHGALVPVGDTAAMAAAIGMGLGRYPSAEPWCSDSVMLRQPRRSAHSAISRAAR